MAGNRVFQHAAVLLLVLLLGAASQRVYGFMTFEHHHRWESIYGQQHDTRRIQLSMEQQCKRSTRYMPLVVIEKKANKMHPSSP